MKALIKGFLMPLLCLLTINLSAIDSNDPKGEIAGIILDESTREPIPFATIAVMNTMDSSLVSGVITNNDGEFLISHLPYGKYNIKVSYMGYEPVVVNNLDLSENSKQIKVEPMQMKARIENVHEVTVTQERLKGEEKIDRTVFTINEDIRKASSTGIDVLKHIPSVTVDFQENVSLEGQSDIQFYVDGVLRNKDYIAQLDPKIIDKIELITNPGVKYDSDISAVINIVLTKTKRSGIAGLVQIPVTNPEKAIFNPKANLEYGNQNFRIYVGDRLHYERFKGKENLYTELDESYANPYTSLKESDGYKSWQSNYLNYGIDWFINEKSSLNLLGEWERQRGYSNDYFSTNSMFQNSILTNYYETSQNSKNTRDTYFYSAFFKQQLAQKESEITAELRYYKQQGNISNDYTDMYFNPEGITVPTDTIYRNDITNNLRNTIEFKSDYTFMIKNLKNETGIKFSELWMNNYLTDAYITESPREYTENFNYLESRRAAYYNLTGKIKNINWQAGLRGEYTSVTIEDTINVNYGSLLPQVNLSRSWEKGNALKLSYRRKLIRPYIQDLNPFVTWMDSLHLRHGNPNLNPALEDRLELTYSKNFNNNYIAPKLYFRHTKNSIQDVSIINDEGVTEITRENIGKEIEYGLSVNGAFQIFKIWRLNANVSLFNREISSSQNLSLADYNQKVSFRANGSSIVQLPKDFSVFTFVQYTSPNIHYQREFSRDFLIIFGMEKQFSKKAKIGLMYNPFIKDFMYSRVITRSQGYFEDWSGTVDAHHLFVLEFTYSFSYGGKVNKMNRTVEYEKGGDGGTF